MNLPAPSAPVGPDPANWLRLSGLFALSGFVAADLSDGELNTDPWAHVVGIVLIVWGPKMASVLRNSGR